MTTTFRRADACSMLRVAASLWLLGGTLALPASAQRAPSMPDPPPIEAAPYDPDTDPLRRAAEPAPPIARLRILLLDLAALLPEPAAAKSTKPTGGYRHTFGAERATPPEQQTLLLEPSVVDADIVLIRSLVSMKLARRLFPARDWRILRPRSTRTDAAGSAEVAALDRVTGPAVAVRLQRGVRITGLDADPAVRELAAVRLMIEQRPLWLASCGIDARGCNELAAWIAARSASGAAVVAGGHEGAIAGSGSSSNTMRLSLDLSGDTAAPIPGTKPAQPTADADRTIRIRSVGERCADRTDRQPAMAVVPAASHRGPYRLLAWTLPIVAKSPPAEADVKAEPDRSIAARAKGAGGPPKPPREPTCGLIVQIVP